MLLEEIPSLKNFHTLSPIPKFREWIDLKLSAASSDAHFSNEYFNIEKALKSDEISFLLKHFETNNKAHMFEKLKVYTKSNEFKTNAPLVDLNEPESSDVSTEMKLARVLALFLQRSCAFYLYREKKNGYAFNPVANFHLRNGALNMFVDCTFKTVPKGLLILMAYLPAYQTYVLWSFKVLI